MSTAVGFTNSVNSNLHSPTSIAKSTGFSVCMFAMMSASTGNDQMLFQLNNALNATGHQLWYDNTTTKTLVYSNANNTVTITTIDLVLGQWYFIALTTTLGGIANVYIKSVGTPTCRLFSVSGSPTITPTTIWIGNELQNSSVKPWLGSICSVKVWAGNLATSAITLAQEELERESEQLFPIRTMDIRFWFPLTSEKDLYSDTAGSNQVILTSGSAALSQTIGPPIPEHKVYSNPPHDIYW